jgi:hypothetical protein
MPLADSFWDILGNNLKKGLINPELTYKVNQVNFHKLFSQKAGTYILYVPSTQRREALIQLRNIVNT